MYRAIIIGIDNDFAYLILKDGGNWFDFQGRSYRKVKEANRQVTEKSGQIKNMVEAIYFEGSSTPIDSPLSEIEAGDRIWEEKHTTEFAMPQTSFWDRIFRRN